MTPISQNLHSTKTATSRQAGGFALIEVVVAVAVAGLAFTTLLGLIAVSLSMMSDARENVVVSLIADQEMTILEASRRQEISPGTRFYDFEGDRLAAAQGAAFVAEVAIEDSPDDGVVQERWLSKVTLTIERADGGGGTLQRHHLWVLNTGAGP